MLKFLWFCHLLEQFVSLSKLSRSTMWRGPRECLRTFARLSCPWHEVFRKTAEPIEMPLDTWAGMGPSSHALVGGPDPHRGRGNFGRGHTWTCPRSIYSTTRCGLLSKFFDYLFYNLTIRGSQRRPVYSCLFIYLVTQASLNLLPLWRYTN